MCVAASSVSVADERLLSRGFHVGDRRREDVVGLGERHDVIAWHDLQMAGQLPGLPAG